MPEEPVRVSRVPGSGRPDLALQEDASKLQVANEKLC